MFVLKHQVYSPFEKWNFPDVVALKRFPGSLWKLPLSHTAALWVESLHKSRQQSDPLSRRLWEGGGTKVRGHGRGRSQGQSQQKAA